MPHHHGLRRQALKPSVELIRLLWAAVETDELPPSFLSMRLAVSTMLRDTPCCRHGVARGEAVFALLDDTYVVALLMS